MTATVIHATSEKGGATKTTTSVNGAAALGLMGKRVLLVDFDPQFNATTACGVDPAEVPATIYEALHHKVKINEAIVKTPHGFDLVPASRDLTGFSDEVDREADSRYDHLKFALLPVVEDYDFIVIDAPPTLEIFTLNALAAATDILIPVQPAGFALGGMTEMVNTFASLVSSGINPNLRIAAVVMTMWDGRYKADNEEFAAIAKEFCEQRYVPYLDTHVRLSRHFKDAEDAGVPAVLHHQKNKRSPVHAYTKIFAQVFGDERA
ncbi:ParA family protein [Tumebacillus lipolyticus]|uniref:ParA family protein n=1 Tax=Tumebacillus lipolyticus TaxID=1280370 RepID=A0ABW5A2D7_9BACL